MEHKLYDTTMTISDEIPAPLSQSEISQRCRAAGGNPELDVHVLQTVGSTNTWLLDGDFSAPVTLCAAEHQTVGRGRRGKTWYSPASGVTFSMRFNLGQPVSRYGGLSLLVGSVLCDCLRNVGVSGARVKWPNDVLVDDAKLAGILIESRSAAVAAETVIVIGMGVNYQRGEEARLIDQASTDLATLCTATDLPKRSQLIADVAIRLLSVVSADVPQAVDALSARWADYDALAGREVVAIVGGENVFGKAAGIDENGGFRIETGAGMRVFNSADVTVRNHI